MTAIIRNDGLIDIIHEYNNININLNNINTLYYYDLSGTYINNDTDVNTSIPSIPLLQKRVADIMIAHAIQTKEYNGAN